MRARVVSAVTVALVAAGCGSTSSAAAPAASGGGSAASGPSATSPAAPQATAAFTNWTTYDRTSTRPGTAAGPAAKAPKRAWGRTLDGAVYGQPLVVGHELLVATENDSVYALSATTGKVEWRHHLATPESQADIQHDQPGCGDIFPLGITGTPAYDASTGAVFVATATNGGHHTLWSLSAATGATRFHRTLDVVGSRDRRAEQERSALLVTAGRVITTFGGLSGDCGNYVGYVASVPTSGHGATTHYAVPTAREAGMWSPAGPVQGANGNVYVASGNGAEEHGSWDKSDSVTELVPATMHRVAVFAPSTWKQDNIEDLDLGSSSPVPVAGRTVIAGKRGTVYLLRNTLGGIGHQVATATGCASYGGAARSGRTVVLPCRGGIRALHVGSSSLHWEWTAPHGTYGSPVIAGDRVYVADRDSGDLRVLSLTTGHQLSSVHVGPMTHFPTEVVDGGYVFVPATAGVIALH